METFTFSFLSSSLYLGFIIKNVAIITSAVSIYDKAPVTPYFILLPITETIATPNSGIEFAKHAANILILNGDNSPPRPINDTINDITYIAIFLSSKTFANILNFFIFVFP